MWGHVSGESGTVAERTCRSCSARTALGQCHACVCVCVYATVDRSPPACCSAAIKEAREDGAQTSLRMLRNVTVVFWSVFPFIWVLVQVRWAGVGWGEQKRLVLVQSSAAGGGAPPQTLSHAPRTLHSPHAAALNTMPSLDCPALNAPLSTPQADRLPALPCPLLTAAGLGGGLWWGAHLPDSPTPPFSPHPTPLVPQLDWVGLYQEEVLWCLADTLGKIFFSSTLLHSNFMSIEHRRMMAMRVVEEANR